MEEVGGGDWGEERLLGLPSADSFRGGRLEASQPDLSKVLELFFFPWVPVFLFQKFQLKTQRNGPMNP